MSANEEREETYDFTRGYYQPLVGVLTMGGDPIKSVQDLAGKSIACTTGTVQNKFITKVMPDADVHTYDAATTCLQEVLAGRIELTCAMAPRASPCAMLTRAWCSACSTAPRPPTT